MTMPNIVREHDGSLWLEITEQQAASMRSQAAIAAVKKEKVDQTKKQFPVGTRVAVVSREFLTKGQHPWVGARGVVTVGVSDKYPDSVTLFLDNGWSVCADCNQLEKLPETKKATS